MLPHRLPIVLGHDLAGVVTQVGSNVSSFAPGDEVFARPADNQVGKFADVAAVAESDLAHRPKSLRMEESAALPLVALTACQALVEIADTQAGRKVPIHAGSGGVGTIAIQLARYWVQTSQRRPARRTWTGLAS